MNTQVYKRPNYKVYLLHFESPISDKHTAQHYIGTALDVEARLKMHKAGKGARLTQVANERGINYTVVRTWVGGRKKERELKNRKEGPRLCPICQAAKQAKAKVDALNFGFEELPELAF